MPESVSAIIIFCWSERPSDRPNMHYVKTNLSVIAKHLSKDDFTSQQGNGGNSLRKSFTHMMKRKLSYEKLPRV